MFCVGTRAVSGELPSTMVNITELMHVVDARCVRQALGAPGVKCTASCFMA